MNEKIKRPSTLEEGNPGADHRIDLDSDFLPSAYHCCQLRYSLGLRAIDQAAREQMRVQSPLLGIKSKT